MLRSNPLNNLLFKQFEQSIIVGLHHNIKMNKREWTFSFGEKFFEMLRKIPGPKGLK
jgi:hypothetical protein